MLGLKVKTAGLVAVLVSLVCLLVELFNPFAASVVPVHCRNCTKGVSLKIDKILIQPYFVNEIVWSRDGSLLAVGSLFNQSINVYKTSDWSLVQRIKRDSSTLAGSYSNLTFSKDSRYLIAPQIVYDAHNTMISMQEWDLQKNKVGPGFIGGFSAGAAEPLSQIPRDNLAEALTLSSDGTLLAAAEGGEQPKLIIYRQSDSQIVRKILCQKGNVPSALALSPDNRILVDARCYSTGITFHSLQTGSIIAQIPDQHWTQVYNGIVFGPDGKFIAVASSGPDFSNVDILSGSDGKIENTLPMQEATIRNIQWNQKENWIIVSYDWVNPGGQMTRIWNPTTGQLVMEFHGKFIDSSALSPDATQLAVARKNELIIATIREP